MNDQATRKNAYEIGASDSRPWGTWRVLDAGEGYAVKRIGVIPGGKLSLQRHSHRAEHWTVVSGTARVQVGDEITDMAANQTVFIPVGAVHRIENIGDDEVKFIEVQCGDILDENDIERLEDVYGRTSD
ncbi:MAG: phosphomannose isomerase type II C-terminal cupin domain [Rhodospirillales bacterium]|nr:phosphomannose isomerase type II C-terminal cupin domain [Rhodospirillales bacterium]